MEKEEAIQILASYKQASRKSNLMMVKIHEMETNLYSAQAGIVENEAGCRVSGGSHKTRAQRLAELVDKKDLYLEEYNKSESICKKIFILIQELYTNSQSQNKGVEALKMQDYENILIEYYINGVKQEEMAESKNYTDRQIRRHLNAARIAFWEHYKNVDFNTINEWIHGEEESSKNKIKEILVFVR